MPAKRVVLDRRSRPQVSPETIALFRRCEALRPLYIQCVRGGKCKSVDPGAHCPECAEFLTAEKTLATACGLNWCDCIGPTDAKSPVVPANLRQRPLQAEAYRQAFAARCALIEADAAATAR